VTTPLASRLTSIDQLRGTVIVLMLLDHVRETFYLHHQVPDPMVVDQTEPALFVSRLLAHLCAPVFVLLTGLSAWLYGSTKADGRRATSAFLLKRGLFLVALELLLYLQKHYARQLDERYKLGLGDEEMAALADDELLTLIGKKRGAVMSGGRLNMQKAAELLITDFRTQMLGRITVETPAEFEQWRAAGEAAEALQQAKKAEHAKHRKAGRKRY